MRLSNLPPGVTDSMIPGNRPEDEEWDSFLEEVTRDTDENGMTVLRARKVWQAGMKVYGLRKASGKRVLRG